MTTMTRPTGFADTQQLFVQMAKASIRMLFAQFGKGDREKFKGTMLKLMDIALSEDEADDAADFTFEPAKPATAPVTVPERQSYRREAKLTSARSLFEVVWCGKAIGDHSYNSLLAIRRDGNEADAIIKACGEVAESDRWRTVKQLLGGKEAKLRAAVPHIFGKAA
jgi:hypothetical protein